MTIRTATNMGPLIDVIQMIIKDKERIMNPYAMNAKDTTGTMARTLLVKRTKDMPRTRTKARTTGRVVIKHITMKT
jgi:hypothetical protein